MKKLVELNNEQVVTTSLVVAESFGKEHKHVLRDIRNLEKDVPNFGLMFSETETPDSYGRSRKTYYINRDGFTLLAMGFTGKEALQFKLDFLNQYNRMEEYIRRNDTIVNIGSKKEEDFKLTMLGVEIAARLLRTDTTSNIRMLEDAHKKHGIVSALPEYVDEDSTSSLTELLKHHEVEMSAVRMNRKLIELGILEEKERPSRSNKSGVKKFKSLTNKGLKYGKNLINPKNQKETQPHYYESKFVELLELVKVQGGNWDE